MDAALVHVELELKRTAGYPFGCREHAYDLYLPLGPDGRLDLRKLRSVDDRYRVRRRLPGTPQASGMLRLDSDGRVIFEFVGRPSNRQLGFPTPPDRFVVGHIVGIDEDDGETRPFEVIAIRRQ